VVIGSGSLLRPWNDGERQFEFLHAAARIGAPDIRTAHEA
jgi:hypothetical protein